MNKLILLFFVYVLCSCSKPKKSDTDILNDLLAPSELVGKISEVKRLGGDFDVVFIFTIKFKDLDYSFEDFREITMTEIKDIPHKDSIVTNLKKYYPAIKSNYVHKRFFKGSGGTSLFLQVMFDDNKNIAYFIADRP